MFEKIIKGIYKWTANYNATYSEYSTVSRRIALMTQRQLERETVDEGDMQLAFADGPRSLVEDFDRISAAVCENVGDVSITPQSGRIMNS